MGKTRTVNTEQKAQLGFAAEALSGKSNVARHDEQIFEKGISDEILIRAGEAAHLLSVSPKTVYKWAKAGLLTRIKISGCVRFRRGDVLRLIQGHRNH